MTNAGERRHNTLMRLTCPLSPALLCTLCLLAEQAPTSSSLLRQGQSYLETGEYSTAANRFEESYNWQPAFEAAFKAGYCHFKLKKFSEAELWLSKARLLKPDDEQTVVFLASAQIGDYKPQQAISLLQEFVKDHPDARQASATLAAIRSDLNPQSPTSRSISQFSMLMIALAALSLAFFFASFRASNAGIREAGKGVGWVGLASLCLLSPTPVILGIVGFAWGGYKMYRGYKLYRYLRQEGSWAEFMRLQLDKFVAAFVLVSGRWDEARAQRALNGLVRAGLNSKVARDVEAKLRSGLPEKSGVDIAILQFAKADTLMREIMLRLLVGMAVQIGYGEDEERLLKRFAAALRLEHRLPDLMADLGFVAPELPRMVDPLAPYFQILDLPPSADHSQVKSGFRKQAKRYHPDVTSHPEGALAMGAADQFRKVREAYQRICKAKGWAE